MKPISETKWVFLTKLFLVRKLKNILLEPHEFISEFIGAVHPQALTFGLNDECHWRLIVLFGGFQNKNIEPRKIITQINNKKPSSLQMKSNRIIHIATIKALSCYFKLTLW